MCWLRDAFNIDLEEVNSDLFADLQNIVDMCVPYIAVSSAIYLTLTNHCRDLSFNLLEEIPTQTFNKLPRLQRLYVSE